MPPHNQTRVILDFDFQRARADPDLGGIARLLDGRAYVLTYVKKAAMCHPHKPHKAKGLCSLCYERQRKRRRKCHNK